LVFIALEFDLDLDRVFFHLMDLTVLEAVRKNPSTSRTSNVEVESFVKKWLRNAADRMGGRANRMQKMLQKKRQRATTAGAGAGTTSHDDRQSSGDGADSSLSDSDISSNDDVGDVA